MNKHEAEVFSKLGIPNMQHKDFKKNCMKAIEPDDSINIQFVPDGYVITEETKTVTVYEVENTNPLTEDKLDHIAYVFMTFDYYYWTLELKTIDRHGNVNDFDLTKQYYNLLGKE
jgi:hypothetical protein